MAGDCEQYFLAHDQAIKEHKIDIENLYKLLDGLPQKVEMVIEILKEIKEQNNKNDEKYISKDVFMVVIETFKQEVQDYKDFKKYVYGSIIVGAGTFIMFLLNLILKLKGVG